MEKNFNLLLKARNILFQRGQDTQQGGKLNSRRIKHST